jgi:riboflavin transporter 2
MSTAINVGLIADPFACLFASFFPWHNLIVLLSALVGISIYMVIVALLSPTPPLVQFSLGGWIVFVVSLVQKVLLAYTKTMVFFTLKRSTDEKAESTTAFRWAGISTQLGAASGSLLFFVLINYTHLFQSPN